MNVWFECANDGVLFKHKYFGKGNCFVFYMHTRLT